MIIQVSIGIRERMTVRSTSCSNHKSARFFVWRGARTLAYWYKRGEISQEKAAQIAGLDRTDFLLELAREGEDAFVVDFADLERELQRG